jgi:hypothetical protein
MHFLTYLQSGIQTVGLRLGAEVVDLSMADRICRATS